jgi:hypothetical protein
MGSEGLLLCSLEPATGPILSQVIQSIPPHPISPRSVLILSFHLHQGLTSDLFPCDFPTKTLHKFLSSPMEGTSYEAAHRFPIMQFSPASYYFIPSVQLFSSASCSQTPTQNYRQNDCFVYINLCVLRQQMRRQRTLNSMIASITQI